MIHRGILSSVDNIRHQLLDLFSSPRVVSLVNRDGVAPSLLEKFTDGETDGLRLSHQISFIIVKRGMSFETLGSSGV